MIQKSFLIMLLLFFLLIPAMVSADGGHGNEDEETSEISTLGAGWIVPVLVSIVAGAVVAGGASTTKRFNRPQLAILGLGTITGSIHLISGGSWGDTLLILNGLGYLALVIAVFAPFEGLVRFRPILQWVLIAYTSVTIIGYFVSHTPAQYSVLGLLTKAIEIGLLVAIGTQLLRMRSRVEA